MTERTHRRLLARQIFLAPILIAALSITGLLAGLLGEGWWDIAADCLLGTTIVTLVALRLSGRR